MSLLRDILYRIGTISLRDILYGLIALIATVAWCLVAIMMAEL